MANDTKNSHNYLIVLLAISLLANLVLLYIGELHNKNERLSQLLNDAIPSACVVLISYIVVYIFFFRQGIKTNPFPEVFAKEIASHIHGSLDFPSVNSKTNPSLDTSKLQHSFKVALNPLEKILKDLQQEHFENKISKHTNITGFHKGTVDFLCTFINNIKDDNHLVIIDSFIDNVVPSGGKNGDKLYDLLRNLLHEKPKVHLSIIAVAYSKNARLQILSRAFHSQEGKSHLYNAQQFWTFVAELLLNDFPNRVSVREINFLPCISAFVVETKKSDSLSEILQSPFSYKDLSSVKNDKEDIHLRLNISDPQKVVNQDYLNKNFILTQCREIYYSPMAAGSSHQCDYFYIKCNENNDVNIGNNYSHEKRLIEYINQCWLLGTKFDKQLWVSRQGDMPIFSNEQENYVSKWESLQKKIVVSKKDLNRNVDKH